MEKRNYIRKIRNATLSSGYIGMDAFSQKIPNRIFVCIWSSEPSIKKRTKISVAKQDLYNNLIFKLKNDIKRLFVLKFSKTSTAFDKDGFFWTATKGHHFEIKGEAKGNTVSFAGTPKTNRFFQNLLQVITPVKNKSIDLATYMKNNFDIIGKNTYAFSIYLQIKFYADEIIIGSSKEKIYRFEDLSFLQDCPTIHGILYEYSVTSKKQRITKKNVDVVHVAPSPEINNQDLELDVRNIFKNSLSPFMSKFCDIAPNDEDYKELIDDILSNLSRVNNEE